MKTKTKLGFKKPLHPIVCWVSLAAFLILGGLALTDNIVTALIALHNGVGVAFFIGYLVGVFLIVILAYLVPLFMMVTYARYARRVYNK